VFVIPEDAAIVTFGQPVTGAVFLDAVYIGIDGLVDFTGKYGDINHLEKVIGGRGIIDAIRGGEPEDILPVYERRAVESHGCAIKRDRIARKVLLVDEDETWIGAGEDHPGLSFEAPFGAAIDDRSDIGG
jgi:hypothetical protein